MSKRTHEGVMITYPEEEFYQKAKELYEDGYHMVGFQVIGDITIKAVFERMVR